MLLQRPCSESGRATLTSVSAEIDSRARGGLPDYVWSGVTSRGHSHHIASLNPNDFGLFDLHGNVKEWCYDAYGNALSSTGGPVGDSPAAGGVDPVATRVCAAARSPTSRRSCGRLLATN